MSTISTEVHAIVVGVEYFALGETYSIDGAARDAVRFAKWLRRLNVPADNLHLFLSPLPQNEALLREECSDSQLDWNAATRANVRDMFIDRIGLKHGRLLFVFWSGHGVLSSRDRRKLFYSDSNDSDRSSLSVNEMLEKLRSTDISGFENQVLIIDACATRFNNLPEDELPCANRALRTLRQFAIFSAAPGQLATQLGRRSEFAEKLLFYLEEWITEPTDLIDTQLEQHLERAAVQIRQHFEALAKSKQWQQTPIDYTFTSWSGKTGGFGAATGFEAIENQGLFQATGSQLLLRATQKTRQERLIKRHQLFGGRDEELRRLDEFLTKTQPYCFIGARSGMGKSALLANWVHQLEANEQKVVYHFISRLDEMADEEFALLNLCEQLATIHRLSGSLPTNRAQLRALWPKLLQIPPLDDQLIVVVIDGLDEAERWSPNFELFPTSLPVGVRVVFSSRVIADQDVIASLQLPPVNVLMLELKQFKAKQISQLMRAAGGTARANADNHKVVTTLLECSAGDPFYLRYLIEDLYEEPETILKDLQRLPRGLNGYLDTWYKDLAKSLDRKPMRHVEVLLGFLVISKGRLMREDLGALAQLNDLALTRALNAFARFVVGDEEHGYALCHNRFQHFLAHRLRTMLADARQRLVMWALEQNASSAEISVYVLRHLAQHLYDEQRTDELCALLNRTWMHRHFERYTGFEFLLADLELAVSAEWREGAPRPERLSRLHTVRQLTRWEVGMYSDQDLATLTWLGEEQGALQLARGRDNPLMRLLGLVAIFHADANCGQAILEEMERISARVNESGLDSAVNAAVAIAFAKSGDVERGLFRARGVTDQYYCWHALLAIAELELAAKNIIHAGYLLNEAVSVAQNAEPSQQWANRLLQTAQVQISACMDVTQTLDLALCFAESGSDKTYQYIHILSGISVAQHCIGRSEEAARRLLGFEMGIENCDQLEWARIQARLSWAHTKMGNEVKAEKLRSAAVKTINASREHYNFDSGVAGVANEFLVSGQIQVTEDLIGLISNPFERSMVLHNLVVTYVEAGEPDLAIEVLQRINDGYFYNKATSYLAWQAASRNDLERARQLFYQKEKNFSYTVRGISSDATANWMRSSLLSLACLVAKTGEICSFNRIIALADGLLASPSSDSKEAWLHIASALATNGDGAGVKKAIKRCRDHHLYLYKSIESEFVVDLARALIRVGLTEDAVDLARNAVAFDIQNLKTRSRVVIPIARALQVSNATAEAEELKQLAIQSAPVSSDADWKEKHSIYQLYNKLTLVLSTELDNLSEEFALLESMFAEAELLKVEQFMLIDLAYAGFCEEALHLMSSLKEQSCSTLESIGIACFRHGLAEAAEEVARRLFEKGFEITGSKIGALAVSSWVNLGKPERCADLLEMMRVHADNEAARQGPGPVYGEHATALAELGHANEALDRALHLPNATINLGIVGTDKKLEVMAAFVRRGSLSHAAQLLAARVSAPDAPDVWLANWGQCLEWAPAAQAVDALKMFVEAAEVVGWVRSDWQEVCDELRPSDFQMDSNSRTRNER